jgi:predicted molibdopterin-dependent oxidoreductase YjgC
LKSIFIILKTKHLILISFRLYNNLSISGNCRICIVELKNSVKPVISCAMHVKTVLNNNVYFDSVLIKKARENVLEFLLVYLIIILVKWFT